ncbi:MAG: hypothetical protein RDV41_10435 [Planctomycetota bacterium]|nr:hypothetical protein [Planctomycetota bacterium]
MSKFAELLVHVLLSFVPGVAQVVRGACLRGVVLFSLFVLAVDGALVAPMLQFPYVSKLLLLAGAVWVVSFVDGMTHGILQSTGAHMRARDDAFRQAHALFLTGQFEEAEETIAELQDRFPHDPAVPYYLGVLCAETGRTAKAKRCFNDAARRDETGLWRGLVQRESLTGSGNAR